jgi:hypothetical protein
MLKIFLELYFIYEGINPQDLQAQKDPTKSDIYS